MRTIIAGGREMTHEQVMAAIMACPWRKQVTVVISGCARGADTHGATIARKYNKPVEEYPADWERYGKSAGYRRNEQMAATADALIAVWDGTSRGTKHMIDIAQQKGLQVFVHICK